MKKAIPILRIILAVSAVLCAAAFVIQTANIYAAGVGTDQMYTAGTIGAHFKEAAWTVVLMTVMIIVGAFLPYPGTDVKVPERFRMQALLKKVDITDKKIAGQIKYLKTVDIISLVLAVTGCAVILVIGFNADLLISTDLEFAVGQALSVMLIPIVILLAGELILAFIGQKIQKKIIGIAVSMPKQSAKEEKTAPPKTIRTVRCVLYAVVIIMIAIGIANGGMNDVFVKAVNICTECIGLG